MGGLCSALGQGPTGKGQRTSFLHHDNKSMRKEDRRSDSLLVPAWVGPQPGLAQGNGEGPPGLHRYFYISCLLCFCFLWNQTIN